MCSSMNKFLKQERWGEGNWLFNVTINDISVMHVTAHKFAGRLKKERTGEKHFKW